MAYDNCEYCGARVKKQKIRVDHRWKGNLMVVEKVPVGVCSRCGERYYDAAVLHQLDHIAKGKVGCVREIRVPVIDFSRAVAV